MIGLHSGTLEPWPRRLIFRAMRGCPDVDTRQKWTAMWPHLSALPRSGITLLDAGCGAGRWAIELAARRPEWRVVALDRVEECLAAAEADRRRLGLSNLHLVRGDLAQVPASVCFDVVLSVFSAHYLAIAGHGSDLFAQFRSCLRPGGRLLALVPRRRGEAPFVSWLPRPDWPALFSADDLRQLCSSAGLEVLVLSGAVGPAGVLAKQVSRVRGAHPVTLAPLYPVERFINLFDGAPTPPDDRRTLGWTLVARASS